MQQTKPAGRGAGPNPTNNNKNNQQPQQQGAGVGKGGKKQPVGPSKPGTEKKKGAQPVPRAFKNYLDNPFNYEWCVAIALSLYFGRDS